MAEENEEDSEDISPDEEEEEEDEDDDDDEDDEPDLATGTAQAATRPLFRELKFKNLSLVSLTNRPWQ
jgi:hypothetical protein